MRTAQQWAQLHGKTTLEQTAGGKYLDGLHLFGKDSGMSGKQAAEIWDVASVKFAQGASGDVNMFGTGAKKMNDFGSVRTWWRIEKPALISNPDVTSVTRLKKDGTPAKTGHVKKMPERCQMNKEELSYIKELKADKSAYEYVDADLGVIRLLIVYRGERLFFQIKDKAIICVISARDAMLSKKSLKKWDDGQTINESERERLSTIISKYYKLSYKDDLTAV